MSDNLIINLGTLSSLNLLYTNLGYRLLEVERAIPDKKIIWDLRQLEAKRINLAALTSFLAISYKISRITKYPIPTLLEWDPYVIKFLSAIGFFEIARAHSILFWDERIVGGFVIEKFNPNNKLLAFDHIPDEVNYGDGILLNNIKEELREECDELILSKIKLLFSNYDYNYRFDTNLGYILSKICSELVVNGLVHGRSPVILGLQRTSAGISVCVADSGMGFLQSIYKSNPWTKAKGVKRNIDALVLASIIPKSQLCLYDVIDSIIRSNGWVTMASVDCELRWGKANWQISVDILDDSDNEPSQKIVEKVIGNELTKYIGREDLQKGYFKLNTFYFPGSRITFEISFL